MPEKDEKRFLFLQGPHGPFFGRLSKALQRSGYSGWRIGFNRGDQYFWPDRKSYIPFTQCPDTFSEFLAAKVEELGITDLVIYGDTRPAHIAATRLAADHNLRCHTFEEGYLRPYWVTYERGGANSKSTSARLSINEIRHLLDQSKSDLVAPPATWGDMRQHVFYSAVYHFFVLAFNRRYPNFRSHRTISVGKEFRLNFRKFLRTPWSYLKGRRASRKIINSGFPYHIALLQLDHDESYKSTSPFEHVAQFLDLVIDSFAKGAPAHHHLVFKAHPLDDMRVPLRGAIKRLANRYRVPDRVHFLQGGKLGPILDHASTAITVNSTAGQQALWRGIPLKAFGPSVYAKPELVSDQPMSQFFANPSTPDTAAYRDFRSFLLETTQIPGGFYSSAGRRQILRRIVDIMLDPRDPIEKLTKNTATPPQQLKVVVSGDN